MRWVSLLASLLVLPSLVLAQMVELGQGLLQGERGQQSYRYLGVPYAAPPLAEKRWQKPGAAPGWDGIRTADAFGPACAQVGNFYADNNPESFGKVYGSEDCLYLNIWTPASGTPISAKPVLVFIHGGGGIAGAASMPAYDAERLAARANAVVVTFNYRLGVFGNLYVPALHRGDPVSDSGYFSLLDQIAALRWVQDNINQFGGDPARVTVMGHSFGAISVWLLMRSPLATGLFQQAISLSGIPLTGQLKHLLRHGETVVERLGEGHLEGTALREALHSKSTDELIEAGRGIKLEKPMIDGTVLVADGEGLLNSVPTMLGSTGNEASLLLYIKGEEDRLRLWRLGRQDEVARDALISSFALMGLRTKSSVYNLVVNKALDSAADQIVASGQNSWRYRFVWDNYPEPWKSVFGSFHGLDVPFIFGNFAEDGSSYDGFVWKSGTREERERLHRQWVHHLKHFLYTGQPDDDSWSGWQQNNHIKIFGEMPGE